MHLDDISTSGKDKTSSKVISYDIYGKEKLCSTVTTKPEGSGGEESIETLRSSFRVLSFYIDCVLMFAYMCMFLIIILTDILFFLSLFFLCIGYKQKNNGKHENKKSENKTVFDFLNKMPSTASTTSNLNIRKASVKKTVIMQKTKVTAKSAF